MARYPRVGFWAVAMLLVALVLVVAGSLLERSGVSRFWGGLIVAFAEAALIGGLADWFAVRALFEHPLGIRIFPHTALIPRNRHRIVREIRNLVQNEWLTKDMLVARVNAFDFVGDGLLSLLAAMRPKLRGVVRTALREILSALPPQGLAEFLGRAAARSLDTHKITPFAADVVHRVREEGWLEPILHEGVSRFQEWARTPENREVIRRHLKEAAVAYCERSVWKNITYSVAEWSGGIDLEQASTVLQEQISRFAKEQLSEDSQLMQLVREGLEKLEQRLRDDLELAQGLEQFVQHTAESGSLAALLGPFLTALQDEGLRELDVEDSQALTWVQDQLQVWVERLAQDPETRRRVNSWCRRTAGALIDKHHVLVGAMVEDRLHRFSDANLVAMIQAKVGEDLNWIRINGSVVGGCVGVLIYLTITLVEALAVR
jgi:uncharacterized membrane-anchored protein YjiN (DUF445 family)